MQLSIILISYNVKHFLEQCLCSVYKSIGQLNAEVWVVDNASLDNSVAFLQPKFPWVKFIKNAKNVGFAKANNQALHLCSGKYVLFLNPDTLVAEDTLVKCVAFMNANAQSGALGVRMIDGTGAFLQESKRSFPSPLASFYKMAGISRLFPASAVFSRYSLTYLDEFKNHEVDVLSGAFMFAKKDVLSALEGFDESFFMYGEDIDLSYRIQKLGYKNYYFSESTIIHFKGESSRKASLKYVKMFYEAMSIFVKKHYSGRAQYASTFFLHTAIWLSAGVSAAAQSGSKIISAAVAGANDFAGKKDRVTDKKHLIVIAANEEEYEEVKTMLTKAGVQAKITRRVLFNEKEENNAEIDRNFKTQTAGKTETEIIFCLGELSYACVIDKIQQLPKKIAFKFHARGTESIVGSNSKNRSGEVIYTKL